LNSFSPSGRVKVIQASKAEKRRDQEAKKYADLAGGVRGGSGKMAAITGVGGAVTGAALGAAFARRIDGDWDFVQENAADDFALKNTLAMT
jgi:hypothetical protein